MQQDEPTPISKRQNIWHDWGNRARIGFALIGLCGLMPLWILIFDHDNAPLWQQWVAVAVFTPMTLVIEWIAVTGRTSFGRHSRVRGLGDRPPAA